jgi:hypothetical protein
VARICPDTADVLKNYFWKKKYNKTLGNLISLLYLCVIK